MSYTVHFMTFFVIVAAAFITGCINYRKIDRKIIPVIIILGYTLVSQTTSYFLAKSVRNNVPLDHIYVPVSLVMWGWFYYQCIDDSKSKMIIKWATPLLIIFSVINTLFIQHINVVPDNIMKLATLFNLIWGSVLLIQLLDLPTGENVFKNPFFLVALALVWFNTISSFYFFLGSFLSRHKIYPSFIFSLHYYSNYVYYLILFTAMVFLKKSNQNVRKIRI